MSKVSKRKLISMPSPTEDRAITAAAKEDPDALPLTPKQLAAMVPTLLPATNAALIFCLFRIREIGPNPRNPCP